MDVKVVYPTSYVLHEEEILRAAQDLYENGECEHAPADVWDAMAMLEDSGQLAFDWAWTERHQMSNDMCIQEDTADREVRDA